MLKDIKDPQNIVWVVFSLYLIPVIILSLFSMDLKILSLGLLQGSVGACLIFSFLRRLEFVPPVQEVSTREPEIPNEQIEEIQKELKKKTEELNRFYEDADKFAAYKAATEDELMKKEALLNEFQETITRQRDVLKKRQEQVTELESKIHDLNYEVNTLLDVVKINETTPDLPYTGIQLKEGAGSYQVTPPLSTVSSPGDATHQLKRCMDIAGKITGANHFEAANSRFKEWHIDNYALDLRRLFDNLRGESSSTIFVFSQKDNRLLFVNNQAKHLLGWTPEKFIQNFSEIIEESVQEWNRSVHRLSSQPETSSQMLMKNKAGQSIPVNCHMGMISSGLFKNHIIGVLYSHHTCVNTQITG